MLRFAANLSVMFTEWPFLDRFSAAADAGFSAIEAQFPYGQPPEVVGRELARNGLTAALFNIPVGDFDAGDRGFAALPDRFADLQASVRQALVYARACGVGRLHLLSGNADRLDAKAVAAYRRSVAWTAEQLATCGIELMLEPINPRNMPGYFLNDFGFAAALIRELKLSNLKLQFDVYHRQLLHGGVVDGLRGLFPLIGHIQIAGVPDRDEPDRGEIDYPSLFTEIERLGYAGFVGCEYRPRSTTLDGLGWFAPFAGRRR